jgi:hypothetical protein
MRKFIVVIMLVLVACPCFATDKTDKAIKHFLIGTVSNIMDAHQKGIDKEIIVSIYTNAIQKQDMTDETKKLLCEVVKQLADTVYSTVPIFKSKTAYKIYKDEFTRQIETKL